MRFTLCFLVLVLTALALAFPAAPDGYRKNKNKKKNKQKSNQIDESDQKKETHDDEETEDHGHKESITHLTCVHGHINSMTTQLKTCQTEMSENCVQVYIAGNKNLKVDSSHYIYSCKKPGFSCKTMKDYIKNSSPDGSWCKECNRKYNGCNVDKRALYDEVLAGKYN